MPDDVIIAIVLISFSIMGLVLVWDATRIYRRYKRNWRLIEAFGRGEITAEELASKFEPLNRG